MFSSEVTLQSLMLEPVKVNKYFVLIQDVVLTFPLVGGSWM